MFKFVCVFIVGFVLVIAAILVLQGPDKLQTQGPDERLNKLQTQFEKAVKDQNENNELIREALNDHEKRLTTIERTWRDR